MPVRKKSLRIQAVSKQNNNTTFEKFASRSAQNERGALKRDDALFNKIFKHVHKAHLCVSKMCDRHPAKRKR